MALNLVRDSIPHYALTADLVLEYLRNEFPLTKYPSLADESFDVHVRYVLASAAVHVWGVTLT